MNRRAFLKTHIGTRQMTSFRDHHLQRASSLICYGGEKKDGEERIKIEHFVGVKYLERDGEVEKTLYIRL